MSLEVARERRPVGDDVVEPGADDAARHRPDRDLARERGIALAQRELAPRDQDRDEDPDAPARSRTSGARAAPDGRRTGSTGSESRPAARLEHTAIVRPWSRGAQPQARCAAGSPWSPAARAARAAASPSRSVRCGATVYVTGRSTARGSLRAGPPRDDRRHRAARRRGRRARHRRPLRSHAIEEVDALRARVESEAGRLDVLVNDIWGGEALVSWGVPFWEHDLDAGLRAWRNAVETHLITSHRLAPLLVANGSGLVIEVTDGDSERYRGSLFYDLAKASAIRLALAQSSELAPHGVAAVSLTPGFLRSEEMLDHFGVSEETLARRRSPRTPTSRSPRRRPSSVAQSPRWRPIPTSCAGAARRCRRGCSHASTASATTTAHSPTGAAGSTTSCWAGSIRSERGRRELPLGGQAGVARPEPATLGEPPPHRPHARNLGVILRVPFAQLPDRRQNALAAGKARLGLAPQPRPGVRARPNARRRPPERAHGKRMRLERPRPRASQTPLRPPDPQERDGEVPPSIGTHELHGMMPLTEPDPHPVSQLPLERLPPSPIKTDSANRHLHRHTTSFVERRQIRHAPTLPRPDEHDCAAPTRIGVGLPSGTHRECHLAEPHSRRRPDESLARSSAQPGSVGSSALIRLRGHGELPASRGSRWNPKWHTRRVPFGSNALRALGPLDALSAAPSRPASRLRAATGHVASRRAGPCTRRERLRRRARHLVRDGCGSAT